MKESELRRGCTFIITKATMTGCKHDCPFILRLYLAERRSLRKRLRRTRSSLFQHLAACKHQSTSRVGYRCIKKEDRHNELRSLQRQNRALKQALKRYRGNGMGMQRFLMCTNIARPARGGIASCAMGRLVSWSTSCTQGVTFCII